ncbi:MAG: L-2-amino-thiazoline-4-carboxylic acid hydrolase [Rickettsiales bacterium]
MSEGSTGNMSNPILNAIKIQSRVVIPITRELEKEVGKEKAHAIIGRAIAASYVAYREMKGFEKNSHPRVEQEVDSGFPVEREVVEDTDESYGYNITGCQFAEYFRAIGEPEIGALMTCGVDYAAEDLIRPGWAFTRTQTRMQGADHCDFRWRKK